MRKSDKKIDNKLRLVLTDVCETALKEIAGFQWLTHTVNYNNFPNSLQIICVFDSKKQLKQYLQSPQCSALVLLIHNELKATNVMIKNINHHVSYDSEESCREQHHGNWALRLKNSSNH